MPAPVRIARRSTAKSSSIDGAAASNSRNRLASISRTRGGEITATGAPARVTSISSPAATRLRTSEKRRATSVALSLATASGYQINQIFFVTFLASSPNGAGYGVKKPVTV